MFSISIKYRQLTIFTLLIALLLAACTPAPVAPTESNTPTTEATTEATEEAQAEPAALPDAPTITDTQTITASETVTASTVMTNVALEPIMGCLEPTAETQLISSAEAGYCFLIPANFERSPMSDDAGFALGIYGPATTEGHRERAFVDVTEAATQTLEAGVQAVIDDVLAALPGFTPTQTSLTLGGLPAIQLDGLPGQDINRKVFAQYEGRNYVLTFLPFEAERPDAEAEAEQLFALVMESFRFMPATEAASSYATFLTWEGEIDGACYTLTIEDNGDAAVGVCGDAPSSTASLAENVEWAAVQEHFGDINAETPAGKIIFQGQGSAQNDQWSQALATWASFKAMEINAGRVGAAAATTLAWQLTTEPEHSGFCSQLVVLAYGYAYANQIECDGSGQATLVAAGWLSDTELDTFSEWVTNGARVEGESGYLDAQGSNPITPEEITFWANAVYFRLLQ